MAGISIGVFVAGLLLGCLAAIFVARRRQEPQPETTHPSVGGQPIVALRPQTEKGFDSRPPSTYSRPVRRVPAYELGNDRLPAEIGSNY